MRRDAQRDRSESPAESRTDGDVAIKALDGINLHRLGREQIRHELSPFEYGM